MGQNGLTVLVPIREGQVEALKEFLNKIGHHIEDNPFMPFDRLSRVHFMRWVVIDTAIVDGKQCPAYLALGSNFDGTIEEHLQELIAEALPGLQKIYHHCKGFPEGAASPKADQMLAYLKRHLIQLPAFYQGHPGRNVQQIHREHRLRMAIQQYLQQSNPAQNWSDHSEQQIYQDIRDHIKGQEEFNWLQEKYRTPFAQRFGTLVVAFRVLLFIALDVLFLMVWKWLGIALILFQVASLILWLVRLRIHEKRDTKDYVLPHWSPEQISDLHAREDYRLQNQLTHLVAVKPGRFRRKTLGKVLWAINFLARWIFNKGSLGGIPSIHFARWVTLDQGRRLLFFSNYDGSWESYLGDFVNKASIGLTGVWSNTQQFPPHKMAPATGCSAVSRIQSLEPQPTNRDPSVVQRLPYPVRPKHQPKHCHPPRVTKNAERRRPESLVTTFITWNSKTSKDS